MVRLFSLLILLIGFGAVTPTADARPPDCSHTHDGCTYDWYSDYGNPGYGTVIVTCGDYRGVHYGGGGC